jgi:molybdenum cofactor cytidylyltransferase
VNAFTGILLAAGSGQRFGGPKLLQPLPDGEAVARAAARHLLAAVPQSVAVVRPGDTELTALFKALGLRVVHNPRTENGMGSSIAAGVAASKDSDGWLIALADMPWIEVGTIAAVRLALADGATLAAPLYRGRRGHPVGFGRRWRTALLGLRGDSGARRILSGENRSISLLPGDDPGVVLDVDQPADLVCCPVSTLGIRAPHMG